jgi:hypothetical protein
VELGSALEDRDLVRVREGEGGGRRGEGKGTDKKEKEDLFLVGVVLRTLLMDMLRSRGGVLAEVEMDEERGSGWDGVEGAEEKSVMLPRKDIDMREELDMSAEGVDEEEEVLTRLGGACVSQSARLRERLIRYLASHRAGDIIDGNNKLRAIEIVPPPPH